MNNLILNIKQTLNELNSVVTLMDDNQFSKPLTIFSGSSVGMHARHIIEFYQCLLFQSEKEQVINYDERRRDLLLESNLEYFAFTVNILIETLEELDKNRLDCPLSLCSPSGDIISENEQKKDSLINSSLARELHYNLEHTIHHAAFIKIGVLSLMPDAQLPKTFGIAPSTLRYQKQA